MAVPSASFPRPHWRLQQLVIPSLVFTVPECWGQGARFLWVNQMLKIEHPLFSYKTPSLSSLSAPGCSLPAGPCQHPPLPSQASYPTSEHGKGPWSGTEHSSASQILLTFIPAKMKEGKGGTWARLAVSIKLHTVWKVPGERLAPRGGGMTLPPSSLLPQPPPPLLYYYFNTNINSSYHVLLLFRSVRP